MPKTVKVNAATLRKLLDDVRASEHAAHARYDRKTKRYPFGDEVWEAASPRTFALYAELRAALGRAK